MKLPDKPSKLLKVALTDLEKCEKDPIYKIDMTKWHRPAGTNKCEVCLAGAVMAKSLKVYPNEELAPVDSSHSTARKLIAIDCLRMGDIDDGLRHLNITNSNLPACLYTGINDKLIENLPYKEWKTHMCDLIGILEAEGM